MAEQKPTWTELQTYPFRYSSNMITINGNTIIAAPTISSSVSQEMPGGLYAYNAVSNDWEVFVAYPEEFESTSHSLAYNSHTNELYLFGYNGRILVIDVQSKQTKQLPLTKSFGSYPSTVFIDNEYHVIGPRSIKSHSVYQSDKNVFDSVHEFEHLRCHQIIFSAVRNVLYLFEAPHQLHQGAEASSIWTLKVNSNSKQNEVDKYEWKKTEYKLPRDLNWFGAVLPFDEECVLIFGGDYGMKESDKIYALYLDTMSVRESALKCPASGQFRAAYCYQRSEKLDVLLAGYVRRICGELVMPVDVLKVIEPFCCADYVHLVEIESGKHWRIGVGEILTSLHDVVSDSKE